MTNAWLSVLVRLGVSGLLGVCIACGSAPQCPVVAPVKAAVAEPQDQMLHAKQQIEDLVLGTFERELIDLEAAQAKLPIHVAAARTNYDEEPALAQFVSAQTAAYLGDQIKLEVFTEKTMKAQASLEQHVIACRDAGGHVTAVALLVLLRDTKSTVVLASRQFTLTKVATTPDYLAWKQDAAAGTAARNAMARIRIEGVNKAKSYNAMEIKSSGYVTHASGSGEVRASGSYTSSKHGSGSASGSARVAGSRSAQRTTSTMRDAGTSGWYPMQQQIEINGTAYKPDRDDLFFDENVAPGSYDIVASFREGFWDSVQERQTEGKRVERSFRLEVRPGEKVRLNVVFICDDTTREILFEND